MNTLLVLLLACGAAEPPSVDDYDASCTTVEDCVLVVDRALDCGCSCDRWVALNKADADRFEADQAAHKDKCRDYCALGCFPLAPEGDVVVECVSNACVADSPDTGLRR